MPNIVFIDDEHGPVDYYVQALLESGFQVQRLDTVEDAFEHLEAGQSADLYVVDIMMPTHGHPRLSDSAYGLASGIVLHREIRQKFSQVPIILLTSIPTPEILGGLPIESNTRIEVKLDTLPFELVEIVQDVLKACHPH